MSDLTITPKTTVHTLLKEYPFLLDFLAATAPSSTSSRTRCCAAPSDAWRRSTRRRAGQRAAEPADGRLAGEIARARRAAAGDRRHPGGDIDPARLARRARHHRGPARRPAHGRAQAALRGAHRRRRGHRDRRHGAAAHRGGHARGRGEAALRRARAGVRRRPGGARGGSAPPGHPLDTFQRENQALLQVTASLRKVAEAIGEPPAPDAWGRLKSALAGTVDRVAEVNAHYLRKENQLFPYLEAARRRGAQQGDVGDPRRRARPLKQAATTSPRTTRRCGEHLPGTRQDGRRHGEQRREDPPPHGPRHPERRGVGGDPRRRRRDRLRLHQPGCRRGRRWRRRRPRPAPQALRPGRPRPPASSPSPPAASRSSSSTSCSPPCPSTSSSSTSTTACSTTARASASSRAAPA